MAKINCLECQAQCDGRTETCNNGTEFTPDITLLPNGGDVEANSCNYCCGWASNLTHSAVCNEMSKPTPNVAPLGGYVKATGAYDKEVGRTMAIWAYAGVFAGTLALYKYLDLFDKDKKKLLIGYGIVFAGLALGSAIGAKRVEQKAS